MDEKKDGAIPRLLDEIVINYGRAVAVDCLEFLGLLPDESIDLIVTSPPYYNAREYAQWASYDDYLADCGLWLRECVRVLKQGRMMCINASSVIEARASRSERSKRYNIPADLHGLCRGLWFAEEIVWEKPEGAAVNRNQRFHVDRHPMQWRANANTERILIYQKPTDKLNDHIIRQQDPAHRLTGDYDRSEIWKMNPERNKEHPAPFPVELPRRLIRYYSWPGETVLDPFCGSGTTAEACILEDRNYLCCDRETKYIEQTKRRIEETKGLFLAVRP